MTSTLSGLNQHTFTIPEFLWTRNVHTALLSPLLARSAAGCSECWLRRGDLTAQSGTDLLPGACGGWQDSVPQGRWTEILSSSLAVGCRPHSVPAMRARPTRCPALHIMQAGEARESSRKGDCFVT